MLSEAQVEIERSIEEVFEYTNNNIPEWSQTVIRDEVIDEKPRGVGTKFLCVTEDRGCRMDFQGLITRYDPPTASAVKLTGKHFDIEAEYFFEELSGRTRVTQRANVLGKGITRVMFFLFGWMMYRSGCKAQAQELHRLKRLLEQQSSETA